MQHFEIALILLEAAFTKVEQIACSCCFAMCYLLMLWRSANLEPFYSLIDQILRLIIQVTLCVVFFPYSAADEFVHPGSLHAGAELDFVKEKIAKNAQPWACEFRKLRDSKFANRKPHGRRKIDSQNNQDASASRDDSLAALTQALLWRLTDNVTFGNEAIAILNS